MADPPAWSGNDPSHDADVPPHAYQGQGPYAEQPAEASVGGLYSELYGSPGTESYADPYADPYASPSAYPPEHRRDPGRAEAPAREIAPDDDGRGFSWERRGRRGRRVRKQFSGTTVAIGAGALVLVLALTGVLLYPTGNGRSAPPGKAGSGQLPGDPAALPPAGAGGDNAPPKAKLPTSPVLGRILDKTADITYARLGGTWKRASNDWMRDHGWPTGQSAIAMRNFEGDGDYLAGCYSGLLSKSISYDGPADLRIATEKLATAVEKTADVYPQKHERNNVESRPLRVGERRGWVLRYELSFPQARKENWDFTKESVAMVLVDRGARRQPGLLFLTLPNSHKKRGDLDLMLNSLRSA